MVLFKEIPAGLKKFFKPYKKALTKKQFKHFMTYVTGLIVCNNKTVQEINDDLSDTDQSSLNRFLTESPWDTNKVDAICIGQIKKHSRLKKGIFIGDPTFIHKTGKHMEKANYHRSGVTKKSEWGYCLVDSLYVDDAYSFPISADFYMRDGDADDTIPFRTLRQIFLDQLHAALKHKLPLWLIMADSGVYADFVLQEIKSLELQYIIGTKITHKISINGKKRISIKEYYRHSNR